MGETKQGLDLCGCFIPGTNFKKICINAVICLGANPLKFESTAGFSVCLGHVAVWTFGS